MPSYSVLCRNEKPKRRLRGRPLWATWEDPLLQDTITSEAKAEDWTFCRAQTASGGVLEEHTTREAMVTGRMANHLVTPFEHETMNKPFCSPSSRPRKRRHDGSSFTMLP